MLQCRPSQGIYCNQKFCFACDAKFAHRHQAKTFAAERRIRALFPRANRQSITATMYDVPAHELAKAIKQIKHAFRLFLTLLEPIGCVYVVEISRSPDRSLMHPHVHALVWTRQRNRLPDDLAAAWTQTLARYSQLQAHSVAVSQPIDQTTAAIERAVFYLHKTNPYYKLFGDALGFHMPEADPAFSTAVTQLIGSRLVERLGMASGRVHNAAPARLAAAA